LTLQTNNIFFANTKIPAHKTLLPCLIQAY